MSLSFNEEHRFGSARFADDDDIRDAGLFKPGGPQIGFYDGKPLFLQGDAPMLTIGGAGSGKLRDLLGYVVCSSPGQRMLTLDPRGELAAISQIAHTLNGEYACTWNPFGLMDLPRHACNPLDILKADAPTFAADCKFITEALVTLSGGDNSKYFELRSRGYIEAILKCDVEYNGRTSLPRLARLINTIETDPEAWANTLEAMLASSFEDVRRTAGEMLAKQQDSPKEFGSIMGEIYANLGFLDDPALMEALDEGDFSLSDLCDPSQARKIFLNVPAEYLSLWSPLLRLFFTVAMLYKARVPSAPCVMLLVDEAGQLGKFEALLRAFTFGRGAGIRAWAIFQDAGQIIRSYGGPSLQSFIGSAQMRQFFGVRDYQTAELVSNMIGSETLSYDDTLVQDQARKQKVDALQGFIHGTHDPFASIYEIAHLNRKAQHRPKQQRKLMTPDEILAMPEDTQILFISGKNLPPIKAQKFPYFSQAEMAGQFLPNPYHPPTDSVRVPTWRGSRTLRVIRESVPHKFASFPQYADGMWAYVDGYKPT
ncbi:MAG: type IV secretory system conjugative DNA transfer family protein [Pseudomonadota bacterium]